MSSYTVDYIVYTAGHRRHHAGTQTPLIPSASGQSNQGEHFPVFAFPSLPYAGANLPFAFMSVVGNANDQHLYTTPGNKDVLTGTRDIRIVIVYAPAGGGDGQGGPGIWVDAFDVDTGEFSDSDFVEVLTDGVPDAAKTATANNEGVVSSVSAEDLLAYRRVDGVPFLEWSKVGGAVDQDPDYTCAQDEGGIVFAFYQSAKQKPVPVPRGVNSGWLYVSPGVLVDAGGWVLGADGKPHPVDPWGPLAAQLMSVVALLSLSSTMNRENKLLAGRLAIAQLDASKSSVKALTDAEP